MGSSGTTIGINGALGVMSWVRRGPLLVLMVL